MSPTLSSALLLLPLVLYTLHALWRLIASDCLTAVLAFAMAYLVAGLACRLALPTLPLVPVWLPMLYPYAWVGTGALLLAMATLQVGRHGLRLQTVPPLMSVYVLSQLCMHAGVLLLTPLLSGRPAQAYAMLPPLVATGAYLIYRLCLWLSRRQGGFSWLSVLLATVAAPLLLGWMAELSVPLMLRHL